MDVSNAFDVVVVGSGIAGTSAAIEAARAGASVALASLGSTFSGSSFFGGTWGLGLVGPEGEHDLDDFLQTILCVGCGEADPQLAQQLVEGIDPAIRWLEEMGVELRRPKDATQRAYVPCFDYKVRGWHGLVRDSLRNAWARELARLGVTLLPNNELVDLVEQDGHVTGALLFDHMREQLAPVSCHAIVLATGGLSALYERRLTADDTCASAHGIALAHGCSLVNAEFLQMMPGIVSPVQGVVINEKAFRFSTLPFDGGLLDERSGYGPFTSRLASHAIDLAIAGAGASGMPLSYNLPSDPPELVADYFTWLSGAFGISPDDEVRIALYAHASNGGIRIAPDASCVGGPSGLFACGECAGGMHGADRIGGLASAAALVFGRTAGTHAAYEAGHDTPAEVACEAELPCSPFGRDTLAELRQLMSAHAMVGRTAQGLGEVLSGISALEGRLLENASPDGTSREQVLAARAEHQLSAARAMIGAMLHRRKSCGSHHRAD